MELSSARGNSEDHSSTTLELEERLGMFFYFIYCFIYRNANLEYELQGCLRFDKLMHWLLIMIFNIDGSSSSSDQEVELKRWPPKPCVSCTHILLSSLTDSMLRNAEKLVSFRSSLMQF